MPITKSTHTPFGAAIGYHTAVRVEAQPGCASQCLMVQVHSWPSDAEHALHEGKGATWQDWHAVPFAAVAALAAEGFLAAVERALINTVDGAFAGGAYQASGAGVDGARARRWANIKAQRDMLDRAPLTHDGMEIDADAGSRTDVMGALMAMQLTGQASRHWRCADNVMRELSLADLVAIGTGIAARRQALIETSDALWQQLQAAQTVAEVDAVTWPTA
jgi:hypothetical protein